MQNAGSMDRTKYLGGSDVAGILGISPWRTPLEVYLDKVQPRIKPVDPSKQKVFTRGQRMEPYVIDLLSEETGLEIIHRGNRYIHRDYGFIAAEIDAEAATGENIEIKTVSPFKAKEWGEVQTDAIPVHYTAQAMHGLMVTGKQVCVFGVLIGVMTSVSIVLSETKKPSVPFSRKRSLSGTGLKPEPSRSNQRQRHISDVRKGLRNKYRG